MKLTKTENNSIKEIMEEKKIVITIITGNAACKKHDIPNILHHLAVRLENGQEIFKIMDENGNSVGTYVEEDY